MAPLHPANLGSNPKLARRQLARLNPEQRGSPPCWAFRENDPGATELAAALPAAEQSDPTLFLAWSANLKRAGDDSGAFALWQHLGDAAEGRNHSAWANSGTRGATWRGSCSPITTPPMPTRWRKTTINRARQDRRRAFLAGWIALRKLHDPDQAIATSPRS